MAKDDPQALCDRLFQSFLGPLVVGGTMKPGKPIGGKRALGIGEHRAPSDPDLSSRVGLARVRIARRLAPVDTFDPAPTADEWTLGAILHDLVQATHPGFDATFRRSGPARILDVVDKTLERVTSPSSVGDALSRHTWFSRMFELTRTDVDLKWWTGSERFLGVDPPGRLTAWPELRRVTQTRIPRPLMELPTSGAAVDPNRFARITQAFLTKTPLTDLATLDREAPAFTWTHENLGFAATAAGRTITSRALALLPDRRVDAALGRATKHLFALRALRALLVAIEVLRDRALRAATKQLDRDRGKGASAPEPLTLGAEPNDASFALSAGALVASEWIAQTGGGFNEPERRALLAVLAPAATSSTAREVKALLAAPGA